MEKTYSIAGHIVRFHGKELTEALASLNGFTPFLYANQSKVTGEFHLTAEEAPQIKTPFYEADIEGVHQSLSRYEKGFVLHIASSQDKQLALWTDKDQVYLHGYLDGQLLRFACWIGFGLIALPYRTIAIHTSAIIYHDTAVLFLGESGTGKSTHTRLWCEHIPGSALLNDDSPILRITHGKPYLYGSPWSGKTPCYKNECYPVAACVRLSQAPHNRITRLPALQAYASLHPSCPPAFAYDENLYEGICNILDPLLLQVPSFHLECLPDAAAARLSCKTIFGL